jgi:hypothetical protein
MSLSLLDMRFWRLQPVLDVTKLDENTVENLAKVFGNCCEKELKRLPEQFDPFKPKCRSTEIMLYIEVNGTGKIPVCRECWDFLAENAARALGCC